MSSLSAAGEGDEDGCLAQCWSSLRRMGLGACACACDFFMVSVVLFLLFVVAAGVVIVLCILCG